MAEQKQFKDFDQDGLEFLADCVNNYGKLEKINK